MNIARAAIITAAISVLAVVGLTGCSSSGSDPTPASTMIESPATMSESAKPSDEMMSESAKPSDEMMEESPKASDDAMMSEPPAS